MERRARTLRASGRHEPGRPQTLEIRATGVGPSHDRGTRGGEVEAGTERIRQVRGVPVQGIRVEAGEELERGLGPDKRLPGGRDIEPPRAVGKFDVPAVARAPRVLAGVPARVGGSQFGRESVAERQERDAARRAEPLVRVAHRGVVVARRDRKPARGLGRVAQGERAVDRGGGADRRRIRYLARRRLHERVGDEPGVGPDLVGERGQRHESHADV